MKKTIIIFIFLLCLINIFPKEKEIKVTGKILHNTWSKSVESWKAGGSDYFVIQKNSGERIILKESKKIKYTDLMRFNNYDVTITGFIIEDKPYKPGNNMEQYPVDMDGNPLKKGGGLVVLSIEPLEKFNTLNFKNFKIEYTYLDVDKNELDLIIKLSPEKGYYLNGKNYPPIKLIFEPNKDITLNQVEYSAKGVEKKSTYEWRVHIKTGLNKFILNSELSVIACSKEICTPIKEKISFEY